MCVTSKKIYGVSAALALLLTLSAPAKAETDIVANGALNFFFPHGAVSLAIGEPFHRHYKSSDYHYEKRRYIPKHTKRHHYDRHNHRYYQQAPKHYVVIEQPHRRHPVFSDHPRNNGYTRNNSHTRHHHNEWRDSKPNKRDYRNESKRDNYHKNRSNRDRNNKNETRGFEYSYRH